MIARSRSGAAFGLAIATLVVFKLWLVHGEEIVGSATQYDALWYLRSARDWYWGATYDWSAFIRPCAYPLWIASVRLLHIPLRLAIELLQIGGALTLVFALRSVGLGRGLCLVSFACLCLHPICFQLNDYTMSDTFYCALLWFTLGGLLLVWSRRDWRIALATGIAIAILWNTREEGILVIVLVAVWSGFLLLENWRRGGPLIALTGAIAVLLIVAVYATNDFVFRSFARSEMTAPVFQSLYHSLLRIKPAEPKPYASITMQTLHRAGAVSPTFAKLCAALDGPIGETWRVETNRQVGTPDEIGVGWIVWGRRGRLRAPREFLLPQSRPAISSPRQRGKSARPVTKGGCRRACSRWFFGSVRAERRSASSPSVRGARGWVCLRAVVDRPDPRRFRLNEGRRFALRPNDLAPFRRSRAKNGDCCLHGKIDRPLSSFLHVPPAFARGGKCGFSLAFAPSPGRARRSRLRDRAAGMAVLSRAALLAWLDATAFDATQDRFLAPILPLWSVCSSFAIALGAKTMGPSADDR